MPAHRRVAANAHGFLHPGARLAGSDDLSRALPTRTRGVLEGDEVDAGDDEVAAQRYHVHGRHARKQRDDGQVLVLDEGDLAGGELGLARLPSRSS